MQRWREAPSTEATEASPQRLRAPAIFFTQLQLYLSPWVSCRFSVALRGGEKVLRRRIFLR